MQARDKQVYHALVKGELTEYLRANSDAFDMIVSADALVYFGALDQAHCRRGGRPPGWRAVRVHARARNRRCPRRIFRLETHGRYTHARAYVERLLAGSGLEPDIACAELRMENGVPVAGLVIRARKAAGDGR